MKNIEGGVGSLVPEHYQKFKDCIVFQETWPSPNIQSWWKHVTGQENGRFPKSDVTRQSIKELCSDKKFSDEECLGAVMAWGRQNRRHGRMLFLRKNEVLPIIGAMRHGEIDPVEAYESFYQIWRGGKPLGMGAAYFTKLIFFCVPGHRGYIMDQWTSKSINLLRKTPLVHLISGHVSKKNGKEVYAQFCNLVDEIAEELGVTGEHIEVAMFSKGGRRKAAWRRYVVNHFKNEVASPNFCGSPCVGWPSDSNTSKHVLTHHGSSGRSRG